MPDPLVLASHAVAPVARQALRTRRARRTSAWAWLTSILLVILLCPQNEAADRYWIATSPANWNSTANWSTSASGAGGASVPGSSDIAYFGADTTKDGDCSVNATASVAGINIAAGYDGVITQGAFTVTVGATGWTQAGGTFTGSATGMTLSGTWSLSGGTFNAGSQTVSTSSHWTYAGGTVGTCNLRITGTMTMTGSHSLSSLNFNGNSRTITIAAGTTITVSGLLTFDAGVNNQVINTGNLVAQGDVTIGASGRTTGTAVITMGQGSGAVSQTLTGNGSPGGIPNLVINTAGTINLVGTIRVSGNWTYTAGTVNAGTSTVNFYLTPPTITGSHTLANVLFSLNSGTAATIASGTTLTVSGTLTLDPGSSGQVIDTGNLVAQGDVIVGSTGRTTGSVVLTMGQGNGAVTQTLTGNGGSGTLPSLIIDSAGTINLVGDIRMRGSWTYTAGTINPGSSTVTFVVSSPTITGSHTLANVTFALTSTTATIAAGTTLTVSGTLNITPTGANQTINGGALVALGDVNSGTSNTAGTVTITLGGSNNQTITKNAGNFPAGSWTVNKTGGVASLAAALSLNAAGQDLTITAGTLSLAGFDLTVNDQLSVGASGVLRLQGGETVTGGPDTLSAGSTVAYVGTSGPYTVKDWSYQHLTFNGAGGVFNLGAAESVAGDLTITAGTFDISGYNLQVTGAFSNAGTLRLQGGETTVTLTMDSDSGTVEYDGTGSYAALKAGNTYNSLSFTGTGTWQHTAALDVNGNLAIASGATLNSAGQNVTLAGNWSNGGTYTPGANTVTLDGTDQSISGSTTFSGLTKIVASAATLTCEAGATQTVAGTLTLQGASGNRLRLRSSIPDTPWLLASSGSRSCTWLDVKDGTSLVAPPIQPSNSLDSLGNLNWFGDALGLCWGPGTTGAADGSTDAVPWSLGSLSPGTTRTSGQGADSATTFAVRNVSAVAVQLTATAGSSGWTIAALPATDCCWLGIGDGTGAGPFTSLDSVTSPSGVVLSASLPASGVQAFDLRLITPVATATTGSSTLTVTLTASPP